jgi:SynChlorMet cassette protein ScmC
MDLTLALADGSPWAIRGEDEEAALVVARLGEAMQLPRAQDLDGAARRVRVVADFSRFAKAPGGDILCFARPSSEPDWPASSLQQIAVSIAREVQRRGGVLLHGALAEWHGFGVILAGPGSVGKTTASERLPPPWRSLCDDTTLVVRDAQGAYWAHPWPTWSRFYSNGPGGSWDVQRAVPLGAVFFLEQAEEDCAGPVGAGRAVCCLVECAGQVSRLMLEDASPRTSHALRLERFDNICALAKTVPAYRLQVSLHGEFWLEMERVLSEKGMTP